MLPLTVIPVVPTALAERVVTVAAPDAGLFGSLATPIRGRGRNKAHNRQNSAAGRNTWL
jgi:hypothetical protein